MNRVTDSFQISTSTRSKAEAIREQLADFATTARAHQEQLMHDPAASGKRAAARKLELAADDAAQRVAAIVTAANELQAEALK